MEYAHARQNMIDGQLRPNKIKDHRVLAAFESVERELFVAPAFKDVAYVDDVIEVGRERPLFTPLTCATMVQALALEPEDRVLVVGAGTGYATAIISRLAATVFALEDDKILRDMARNNLVDSGCQNVVLLEGQMHQGYADAAPYNKIFVDIPVRELSPALVEQVQPGGKLAAVTKGKDGICEVTLYTKLGKTLLATPLSETKSYLQAPASGEEAFVF
jgi:protein-L-isoaspartate(D-aspartate) O-methyltransferase